METLALAPIPSRFYVGFQERFALNSVLAQKAGKIFLASSHGTTLCKTGHGSESTLTCFEHFLYFIQIV